MKVDSMIFDMDGTLWDNVDTYVAVWNKAFETTGYDKQIGRDDLLGLMGKELREIMSILLPNSTDEAQNLLQEHIAQAYRMLLPTMNPIVYPYVLEGLELLQQRYRLFLLSNCEEGGLVKFMNHTHTTHLITDYMEHGKNLQTKSVNLRLLIEKYHLKCPVYVGDTDKDSVESAKANVPFIYVAYGFGKTENYDLKFHDFKSLAHYFLAAP